MDEAEPSLLELLTHPFNHLLGEVADNDIDRCDARGAALADHAEEQWLTVEFYQRLGLTLGYAAEA